VTTAEPQASLKPAYEAMFDGEELARIEEIHTGGAALILGMIKSDMEWHHSGSLFRTLVITTHGSSAFG
jgi:hypothetical protein